MDMLLEEKQGVIGGGGVARGAPPPPSTFTQLSLGVPLLDSHPKMHKLIV